MMEYWNTDRDHRNRFMLLLIIPTFQYSTIPAGLENGVCLYR
jgi:hypothetical protein